MQIHRVFMVLVFSISCSTIPAYSPQKDEVDWSQCVRDILPGPDTPTNPYPRVRDFSWMSRNEWCTRVVAIRKDTARAAARLVFIGDSITQMWPKDLWTEKFSTWKPLRMRIGGDRRPPCGPRSRPPTIVWQPQPGAGA
jgi:hypothetical protein